MLWTLVVAQRNPPGAHRVGGKLLGAWNRKVDAYGFCCWGFACRGLCLVGVVGFDCEVGC
jgi:hypothetical protein